MSLKMVKWKVKCRNWQQKTLTHMSSTRESRRKYKCSLPFWRRSFMAPSLCVGEHWHGNSYLDMQILLLLPPTAGVPTWGEPLAICVAVLSNLRAHLPRRKRSCAGAGDLASEIAGLNRMRLYKRQSFRPALSTISAINLLKPGGFFTFHQV